MLLSGDRDGNGSTDDVGQLLAAWPSGALIIIFADHGMHRVEEVGRKGNHGNLSERDMLIPIWTVKK
jgi:predicted AlkP superfamily pyrophosphatase or phosphodiesterase